MYEWSEYEITRLKQLYAKTPRKFLPALFPGRNMHGIESKASKLKIKKEHFATKKVKGKKHVNKEKKINMRPLNLATKHGVLKTRVQPETKAYRVNQKTIVFLPLSLPPEQIAHALSFYNTKK